jgi:hypothetical protein
VTPSEHDPIVGEVREIRDAYAKQHGYDLHAIVADLRRRQLEHGAKLVTLAPHRIPEPTP